MSRRLFMSSISVLIGVTAVFAQNGKISGRVVDSETKQPLFGANVIVVGTTFGAATDIDGGYVILNLPPGHCDVRASLLGYQAVIIQEVNVVAGLTQEVNFALAGAALEVQPVIIIAEAPLIQKSATNAVRIMKEEEIAKLPSRSVEGLIALQPGVVLQNDLIHIRGSRPDEVGYTIDGATTTNIMNRRGGSSITTIPEALEEVLVQAGGYTAEFGGANAGLVQQNFKTGREQRHASFQMESDNFADPGRKFLGTYSYGYTDYVLSISGPTISEKAKIFLAGENFFIRDYTPTFWSALPERWSDGSPIDTVYDSGARNGNPKDFQILSWNPGNIPGRFLNRYSLNGTLLLELQPVYVKIGGAYSHQRKRINDDPIGNLFNQDRLPLQDQSQGFLNGKITYFITPKTFIEANLNFLDRRFKTYDPIFQDDLLAYTDSLRASEHGWAYSRYTQQPYPYDFYGFPFNRPGTATTGYGKNHTGYAGFSLSATLQMSRHELKIGGSFERWTARNYGFAGSGSGRVFFGGLLASLRQDPDLSRDAQTLRAFMRSFATPDMYGFDEFGNPINSGPDGPKHPKFFSAYVQDKIEFEDVIIQAGLRFDHIDMDTWSLEDPSRPRPDESTYTILDLKKNKAYQYISPRLGFSYPVTDKTVFHVQYGKFIQAPGLDVAYRGVPRTAFVLLLGTRGVPTDPIAYGLEPTRTTQYEVGFTQQFTDFAAFDVTAFYKDIKGQLQYDLVQTAAGWTPSQYTTYINGDFATTKGLEFRLTLRRTNRVQAVLNYAFSDARGTNSFPTSARGAVLSNEGKPTMILPLSYDQTHRGSINVDYRFAAGDGGPILERLGVNLLFTFNSGHPFTKERLIGFTLGDPSLGTLIGEGDGNEPLESINASSTPWNFNLDLRLDKTIAIGGFDANLYVYVQNVLNTKNVTNVYLATGNAYDDGFLINPANESVLQHFGPRYVDLYRTVNLENRRHQVLLTGQDLFGSPRQIRFGARVEI